MNFKNKLFFLLFFLICSCTEEEEIILFSTECIECQEYEYSQAYNGSFILLNLEAGIYCVGDSAWLMPNNIDYWTQIDSPLLNLMTESGHCNFLYLLKFVSACQ